MSSLRQRELPSSKWLQPLCCTEAALGRPTPRNSVRKVGEETSYPLVNIQKAPKSHRKSFFCVFWQVNQLSMVIFNSKVSKFQRVWPFSTGKIRKIRINQWMVAMMVAHDFFSRLHRCCQRIGPLYHAVVRHGIHGHNSKNAGWCFLIWGDGTNRLLLSHRLATD